MIWLLSGLGVLIFAVAWLFLLGLALAASQEPQDRPWRRSQGVTWVIRRGEPLPPLYDPERDRIHRL